MLQRMLFVGVGGSGLKTLQILRSELSRELRSRGWRGDFPHAWQFVALDLPAQQERVNGEIAPLDGSSYYALGTTLGWDLIEEQLEGAALANYAAWRPQPGLEVDSGLGASQYRGFGRAIFLPSLHTVSRAIDSAVTELGAPSTQTELTKIAQETNQPVDTTAKPLVFVIASLAGGTGAAGLLDVCDLIRLKAQMQGSEWLERTVGVLYLPDVFFRASDNEKLGMGLNTLATMAELVSSFYHGDEPRPLPFHQALGGGFGTLYGRRGPQFPMVIGRSARSQPDDAPAVWGSVANALKAITLSSTLQSRLVNQVMGNWPNSGNLAAKLRVHDDGAEKPISSFGYAQLSMGRDLFAAYAEERLASGTADRLLRAHLDDDVEAGRKSAEVALAEAASEPAVTRFLDACGLNERTEHRNQIIDQLRPDSSSHVSAVIDTVVKSLRSGGQLRVDRWIRRAAEQVRARNAEVRERSDAEIRLRALAWVDHVQGRVLDATVSTIADSGLPVALKILEAVDADLTISRTELKVESDSKARGAKYALADVAEQLRGITDEIDFDFPELKGNVEAAIKVHFLDDEEQRIRILAADLIEDLQEGLIRPIARELTDSLETLQLPASREMVGRWSSAEGVARRLEPPATTRLLTQVDEFPGVFDDLLAASVDADNPERAAITRLLSGVDREGTRVVESTRWVNRVVDDGLGEPSGPASISITLGSDDLLRRANEWISHDGDSGIGKYLAESLDDYLSGSVAPAELALRMQRFEAEFRNALKMSYPMVALDAAMLSRVHGTNESSAISELLMDPLPFGTGKRAKNAREAAVRVLVSETDLTADEIDPFLAVRTGPVQAIDILQTLSPMHPMTIQSYTESISSGVLPLNEMERRTRWQRRRARPLGEYVPLPLRTTTRLVRGFYTGLALGSVRATGHAEYLRKGNFIPFPDPVGGHRFGEAIGVLAAVLETYPLAEVLFAKGDAEALTGYSYLLQLGAPLEQRANNRQSTPLLDWVRAGQVPDGATPAILGDDSEARAAGLTTLLHETREKNSGAQESEPGSLMGIRPLVNHALRGLLEDLGSVVNRADNAEPGAGWA